MRGARWCGREASSTTRATSSRARTRPALLGTNSRASHGCIRVSKAMSDTIWAFAASSTKVIVVR
ncbi:L,D-transpeptidase [Kribbella alba]|uniref:L,D-transpeptidase family protein n=1 Tax=Kribbella alba TaxID=190197 RepID=UPI0031D8B20D